MKLRELKNTVVRCETEDEYNRLIRIYKKGGWRFRFDYTPTDDGRRFVDAKAVWDRWSKPYDANAISLSDFLREQGLEQEELKAGDWVEVIEDCTIDRETYEQGQKFRLVESNGVGWPVALDISSSRSPDKKHSLNKSELKHFRKCSPPEEKGYRWQLSGETATTAFELHERIRKAQQGFYSSPTPFMDCCTSIVNKARDLALSPMERKYRKLGLKNADGLTASGREVFLDLLFEKFGKELMDPRVKQLASKKDEDDE
jgi:hypothetical protein